MASAVSIESGMQPAGYRLGTEAP